MQGGERRGGLRIRFPAVTKLSCLCLIMNTERENVRRGREKDGLNWNIVTSSQLWKNRCDRRAGQRRSSSSSSG